MAVTKQQVAELYVSVFDRAPDAAGLAYWVDESGLTIEGIAQSFFDQDETQAKYPDTLSDAAFVEAIYNNMFDHAPDADGLVYWENELTTGNITRGNMILAIANGALGTDDTILANKTEVGLYFADAGLNDLTQAADALDGVNADAASVVAGKAKVDTASSLDLTTGKDTIVGTDADNTINGTNTTYTVGDSVDGGAGNDTLSLKLAAATANASVVTNVETVNLEVSGAGTFNVANFSGVENYTLTKTNVNVTVSNIGDVIKSITIDKLTGNASHSFAFDDGLLTGTQDTLDVTLSNSTAISTLNVGNVTGAGDPLEILNIHSTGNSGAAELNITNMDGNLESITITGDSLLKLTTSATAKLATVDASALTGALTYTSTSSLATGETIKGGSAGDTLKGSDVKTTIEGGAGADTLTSGGTTASTTTILTGGAGKDSLVGNTGIDTFAFSYTGDTGVTTATADIITTFTSGTDKITIAGIGAATASNTVIVGDVAVADAISTVEGAVSAANTGTLAGKKYVVFEDSGANITGTWIAFDSNGDGKADGAIAVTGADVAIADII